MHQVLFSHSRLPLAAILAGGFAFSSATGAAAQTSVGGEVLVDTTWTAAGSPYVLSAPVHVTGGATLTIEPGVRVEIPAGLWFVVGEQGAAPGTLVARGEAAQPITFTSTTARPGKGDWTGLSFGPNTVDGVRDPATGAWLSGSVLEHCVVEYGGGDYFDETGPKVFTGDRYGPYGMIEIERSSPLLRFLTVRNALERGLFVSMEYGPGTIRISDSTFDRNGDNPFNGYGGGLNLSSMVGATVERCTFRKNRIDASWPQGAGIQVSNAAQITIRECAFLGNEAERYANGIGGGIALLSTNFVTVEDCVFFDNEASIGGAISDYYSNDVRVSGCHVEGSYAISDNVSGTGARWTVEDCTFVGNTVEGAGGGLGLRGTGGVVRDNVFRGNVAGSAAGAMIWYDTLFEGNVVEDNTAVWVAGGVMLSDSGGWSGPSGLVFRDNVVRRNHAGWYGGGLAISLDHSTLVGNTIRDNTADLAGGGVYVTTPYDEPSMTIDLAGQGGPPNRFWGNQSPAGAAIFNDLPATSVPIDASGVCWGTHEASAIEARIWHHTDDRALGVVLFDDPATCWMLDEELSSER